MQPDPDDAQSPIDRLRALPAGATRQFDFCAEAPIVPEHMETLRRLLAGHRRDTIAAMQGSLTGNHGLNFRLIPSIHYARLVILAPAGENESARLLLSTVYDGPIGEARVRRKRAQRLHLEQLAAVAGSALDALYRCCEGYAGLNNLQRYLEDRTLRAAAFYIGAAGRSREQILGEEALRLAILQDIDALYRSATERTPESVRSLLADKYNSKDHPLAPFGAQPNRRHWVYATAVGALGLLGLAITAALKGPPPLQWFAIALALGVFGAIWRFRHLERTDPEINPVHGAAERNHLAEVAQDENLFFQNELSHCVAIKPGLLRRTVLCLVFAALRLLMRNWYKRGNFPSIHFARWCRIDGGRRLLFLSNFDNSWENYLGDFIDQASLGLTGVWSNTVGFPRTRWLVNAGSRAARRFKAWTRMQQIRTQVWYSAYPHLAIRAIHANTQIRRGLAQPSSMPAAVWLDWLQGVDRMQADAQHSAELATNSLAPAPRSKRSPTATAPAPTLDRRDIQGLILHGYGPKLGAQFLLLRVEPNRAHSARRWLGQLPIANAHTSERQRKQAGPFLNLAFTHEGLAALELDPALLGDFPIEFVQGASHPMRCRTNGDVGANAPERWRWGTAERSVHAMLLVYDDTEQDAAQHCERLRAEAQAAGLQAVGTLEGKHLPGRKEHFGFRDGIAQPAIAGAQKPEPVGNTLPAGEVLLGHTNSYGDVAYAPTAEGCEGFGHNGSYLVFRQLEQDVRGFWHHCQEQAQQLRCDPITIAAKFIGRWPSGAPLVLHPHNDPQSQASEDEDRFAYLARGTRNDRGGNACPFGAHIRRTNPRDWELGSDRKESLLLANRHRIVRRGRPYGPPMTENLQPSAMLSSAATGDSPAEERGLQFLALGANIQRQFEFIQQQWSQSPTFAGLSDSPDPANTLALPDDLQRRASFTIQGEAKQGAFARCLGLKSFVTLRGAAYLFLPSISAIRSLAAPKGLTRAP